MRKERVLRSFLSFSLFLAVFLTLYGLLHLYLYVRLRGAIHLSPLGNGMVVLFLLIMMFAPVLVNLSVVHTNALLTAFLTYTGYTWMAVVFLFFSTHILIDLYNGIISLSTLMVSPALSGLKAGIGLSFPLSLLTVLGIVSFGAVEARKIRTEKVVLRTEKLPPGVERLRIVQISDIHFSTTNGAGFAQGIVDLIKNLHPDVLVSTGDLIERSLEEKERVMALFKDVYTPLGKYAVTGNHEFYTGIQEAVQFTEGAGFRMLRNEGLPVGNLLNIVGVDDPASGEFGLDARLPEVGTLTDSSGKRLTILLKHRPRIDSRGLPHIDLQLSGHTHKGQIFPFGLVTSRFFPFHSGLYRLAQDAHLYVSRGTGTWGPPVRFLSPPEITVIDFYPLP